MCRRAPTCGRADMLRDDAQAAEFKKELATRILQGCRVDPSLAVRVVRYAVAGRTLRPPILDLGCELGIGSWLLRSQATRVIGGDNRWDHLAFAHSMFDDLQLVALDGRALPFADGTLGGVCAFSLLELVDSWETVADEIRRVLRPDGAALLSNAPSKQGPTARARAIYARLPCRFPASISLGIRIGENGVQFRLGSNVDDIWMIIGGHRSSIVAQTVSILQALDLVSVTGSCLASLPYFRQSTDMLLTADRQRGEPVNAVSGRL